MRERRIKNMTNYESLEIEVITFEEEDVIAISLPDDE